MLSERNQFLATLQMDVLNWESHPFCHLQIPGDPVVTLSASMERRQQAVSRYLQKIWCTCDYDSDSTSDEDETQSNRQNATREELYSKSNDYNEDHSRAGVFRASSRRNKHNRSRKEAGDHHGHEKGRSESTSFVDGSHLPDNISHLSVASANESTQNELNNSHGQAFKQ